MIPPISVTAVMLRRCARLNGVSRTISTRRRRSLSTTSAARAIRLSDRPWATAASVFIEQGAITMPSDWNEPLAMDGADIAVFVHHVGQRLDVAPLQADFLMQGEGGGVGDDQVGLDAGHGCRRCSRRTPYTAPVAPVMATTSRRGPGIRHRAGL